MFLLVKEMKSHFLLAIWIFCLLVAFFIINDIIVSDVNRWVMVQLNKRTTTIDSISSGAPEHNFDVRWFDYSAPCERLTIRSPLKAASNRTTAGAAAALNLATIESNILLQNNKALKNYGIVYHTTCSLDNISCNGRRGVDDDLSFIKQQQQVVQTHQQEDHQQRLCSLRTSSTFVVIFTQPPDKAGDTNNTTIGWSFCRGPNRHHVINSKFALMFNSHPRNLFFQCFMCPCLGQKSGCCRSVLSCLHLVVLKPILEEGLKTQ